VELLAKNNPSALGHISNLNAELFDNYDGHFSFDSTPLHCYLSRTSNLQLDTVKILVELCPESLKLSRTEDLYFPIHTIMENPEVGSYCEVVQYLVNTDPTILQDKGGLDQLPLHTHTACCRSTTTASLVHILVDGYQDATREADCDGHLPIHLLCENEVMGKGVKLDILRMLIDKYPESLHARTRCQNLPIHIAPCYQDFDFCKILVDNYPGGLAIENGYGCLPFHLACDKGSLEIVKYLYDAYQECINKSSTRSGFCPIHTALMTQRKDQYEIIKFLLQCDPNCAAIALPNVVGDHILLPLYLACQRGAHLETVQLLFDAYPAVIYAEEGSGVGTFIVIPSAAASNKS